jgi:hypothetical protein
MSDDVLSLIGGEQPKTTPQQGGKVSAMNVGNIRPVGGTGFVQHQTYEEGIKAIDDNLKAYGSKHGINTIRGVISRWAPPSDNNDTEAYIRNVSQKTGIKPDEKIDLSNPVIRHILSGPIILQEKGVKSFLPKQDQQSNQQLSQQQGQQSTQQPTDDVSSLILGTAPTKQTQQTQQVQQVQPEEKPQNTGAFVGFPHLIKQAQNATPSQAKPQLEQMGQELTSPSFIGKDLAAKFDNTIGSVLPFFTKKISQAGTRFLGADKAAEISDRLTSYVDKPVGKAFGITEDPVYQNEALGKIMGFIGENKEKGDEWIANNTGLNKNDVQFFTDLALIKAGEKPTTLIKKPIEAAETVASSLQEALSEIKKPKTPSVTIEGVNYQPTLSGVGAAKTEINPYGRFTGEDIESKGQYPQIKLSRISKDVPKTEQSQIAQIVNEIGGGELGLREGVKTRNENTLRNEFAEAKMPNPTMRGQVLKEQIANEQNALYRYGEQRITNTGANKNLLSDYERGQVMHDAIASEEGLLGHIKQEKQSLFQEAKDKVGDNSIQTTHVNDLLSDPQFKAGLGLKKNEGVAASAEELIRLAKEVGFKDDFGVVHPPGSISAYDAVKKSLNAGWSLDNAKIIARINRAIDQDIAAAGGEGLYKKADKLHEAEKTLFESKGMKQLFGELDPNGIQKGVPFEQMITKLNQMPVDQWKHVFDTLTLLENGLVKTKKFEMQVPKEIQDYARVAKAEMLGGLAREIYQAGAKNAGEWNKNAVNTVLNARAEKIKHGFPPSEQKAFHTLNLGGHFMQPKHEYEGAGLQQRRVGLIEKSLPGLSEATGAAVGTAIAPGVGTAIGSFLGRKQGEATQSKLSAKKEKKESKKLQEQLKKNIKLSDIGKE